MLSTNEPLHRDSTAAATPILIEIAPGELLDKITILEIKNERISDEGKRKNVRAELTHLAQVASRTVAAGPEITALKIELKAVNEALWEIEDEIRVCESKADFGPRFIELARSVYQQNDRRAMIKKRINLLLKSRLIEEKSYTA